MSYLHNVVIKVINVCNYWTGIILNRPFQFTLSAKTLNKSRLNLATQNWNSKRFKISIFIRYYFFFLINDCLPQNSPTKIEQLHVFFLSNITYNIHLFFSFLLFLFIFSFFFIYIFIGIFFCLCYIVIFLSSLLFLQF